MSDPVGGLSSLASMRIAQFEAMWQDGPKRITLDAGAGGDSFGNILSGALGRVSDMQDTAANYATAFARGENVELHQVMASTEEAGIALEMLVELRNKVLDAYHTLSSMQG